jgi:hypothetical protein
MNEGHYIGLRNYAEEHSSLLRQILEAQNKTNEMLSQLLEKPVGVLARDLGTLGPISAGTGEPVLPGATTKTTRKGK